jgi:hypothetical protein
MRDQVSCLYKTTGKILVLYIFILGFHIGEGRENKQTLGL